MNIFPEFIRRRIKQRPNLVKIADNMGWLFFDKVLRMGVGVLLGVWLARYLGPVQFGIFNFAYAFMGVFVAVATLGLQNVVVREIVLNLKCKEEVLGTAAMLHFIGSLVAYSICFLTITWIRPDDTLVKSMVTIMGLHMLFRLTEVTVYWFESQVISKYTVIVQNSVFLCFAFFKVLFILGEASIIAFAWLMVVEVMMASVLMCVIFNFHGPKIAQLRISIKRAKMLLKDSWPLLMTGVIASIYMKIDQIMLGQIAGDGAVGVYSAAIRISELWYFLPTVVAASMTPALIEAKQQNEVKYNQLLQYLFSILIFVAFIIALPISFLSTTIILILYGDAYVESGKILSVSIWTCIFMYFNIVSSLWFVANNRQILIFWRSIFGLIINIILNYIFIPNYGAIGAAFSTLAAQFMVYFLIDYFMKETRSIFKMKVNSLMLFKTFNLIRNIK